MELAGTIEATDASYAHGNAATAPYDEAKTALEAIVPEGHKGLVIRTLSGRVVSVFRHLGQLRSRARRFAFSGWSVVPIIEPVRCFAFFGHHPLPTLSAATR